MFLYVCVFAFFSVKWNSCMVVCHCLGWEPGIASCVIISHFEATQLPIIYAYRLIKSSSLISFTLHVSLPHHFSLQFCLLTFSLLFCLHTHCRHYISRTKRRKKKHKRPKCIHIIKKCFFFACFVSKFPPSIFYFLYDYFINWTS